MPPRTSDSADRTEGEDYEDPAYEDDASRDDQEDWKADLDLDLDDLLYPLGAEDFFENYWGRSCYTTKLDKNVLDRLRAGFWNGKLSSVIPQCRKDDNTAYTCTEAGNMEDDLDIGRTLNLPFCFTPGALEMKSAFIEQGTGKGNDIEIGVYVSKYGGETTSWHFDNNHNITIQLYGEKDWHHIPGSSSTVSSRAMQGVARNRFEQLCRIPPTGNGGNDNDEITCQNLRAGTVIYLPPGHWHQVRTASGKSRSFSVDIRVANMLQSKWICEAIYAGLLEDFYVAADEIGNRRGSFISERDFRDGALSDGVEQQKSHLTANLEQMLQCSKPLRWIPFQRRYSDGMNTGGTLSFLKEKSFISDIVPTRSSVIGVNCMVAISLRCRASSSGSKLLIDLRSESALTTMEYLRYTLICSKALYTAVDLLRTGGLVTVGELHDHCGEVGSVRIHPELSILLRVLIHANVLHIDCQNPEQRLVRLRRVGTSANHAPEQPELRRRHRPASMQQEQPVRVRRRPAASVASRQGSAVEVRRRPAAATASGAANRSKRPRRVE